MEPEMLSRKSLYIASFLLILGGLLGFSASSIVRFLDGRTADTHRLEAEAWVWRDRTVRDRAVREPSLTRPKQKSVIVPGKEGYLLEIPAIGLRAVVRELELTVFSGTNTPLLKRYGLGQVPYTDYLRNVSPGGEGTAAITGHRTTSGAPFRHIDRLRQGNLIIVRSRGMEQEWEVVRSVTVLPSTVQAIRSLPGTRTLVLLACNPPFSARERLVVYARLKREAIRVGATDGVATAAPIENGGGRYDW
jgi:LPXTG-site transpeptidase (sortase) family protein